MFWTGFWEDRSEVGCSGVDHAGVYPLGWRDEWWEEREYSPNVRVVVAAGLGLLEDWLRSGEVERTRGEDGRSDRDRKIPPAGHGGNWPPTSQPETQLGVVTFNWFYNNIFHWIINISLISSLHNLHSLRVCVFSFSGRCWKFPLYILFMFLQLKQSIREGHEGIASFLTTTN